MVVARMLIASTFLTEFIKPQNLRKPRLGKPADYFRVSLMPHVQDAAIPL